jgi:hypothetical protein
MFTPPPPLDPLPAARALATLPARPLALTPTGSVLLAATPGNSARLAEGPLNWEATQAEASAPALAR